MADALPNKAAPQNGLYSLLDRLPSIIELFSGKQSSETQTTAPSSSTETTSISKEGMDALIKQILDSNRGLASVTQGQRSAGLYNSATSSLLANDLITRAAGEVAAKTATTTKTSPGTTRTATNAVVAPLQGKGGIVTTGLSALGVANKFKGNLFGDAAAPSGLYESMSGRNVVDMFNSGEYMPGASGSFSIMEGGVTGYSGWQDTFGMPSASIAYDAAPTAVDAFSADYMPWAESGGESFVGDVFPSGGEDAATSFLSDAGGGALGGVAMNPLTMVGGWILGEALAGGDRGPSVICTEALRQGLMNEELYKVETQQYFPTLSVTLVSGYHYLAIPVVGWMRRSETAAKFFAAGARAYAMHTTKTKRNFLGFCIKWIGEPLCYAVGKLLQFGRGVAYGI